MAGGTWIRNKNQKQQAAHAKRELKTKTDAYREREMLKQRIRRAGQKEVLELLRIGKHVPEELVKYTSYAEEVLQREAYQPAQIHKTQASRKRTGESDKVEDEDAETAQSLVASPGERQRKASTKAFELDEDTELNEETPTTRVNKLETSFNLHSSTSNQNSRISNTLLSSAKDSSSNNTTHNNVEVDRKEQQRQLRNQRKRERRAAEKKKRELKQAVVNKDFSSNPILEAANDLNSSQTPVADNDEASVFKLEEKIPRFTQRGRVIKKPSSLIFNSNKNFSRTSKPASMQASQATTIEARQNMRPKAVSNTRDYEQEWRIREVNKLRKHPKVLNESARLAIPDLDEDDIARRDEKLKHLMKPTYQLGAQWAYPTSQESPRDQVVMEQRKLNSADEPTPEEFAHANLWNKFNEIMDKFSIKAYYAYHEAVEAPPFNPISWAFPNAIPECVIKLICDPVKCLAFDDFWNNRNVERFQQTPGYNEDHSTYKWIWDEMQKYGKYAAFEGPLKIYNARQRFSRMRAQDFEPTQTESLHSTQPNRSSSLSPSLTISAEYATCPSYLTVDSSEDGSTMLRDASRSSSLPGGRSEQAPLLSSSPPQTPSENQLSLDKEDEVVEEGGENELDDCATEHSFVNLPGTKELLVKMKKDLGWEKINRTKMNGEESEVEYSLLHLGRFSKDRNKTGWR